jgi:hypothetical protein
VKLFILSRSSGNWGTVTFSVIEKDEESAIAAAREAYPGPLGCEDFYFIQSVDVAPGVVLWSENNE